MEFDLDAQHQDLPAFRKEAYEWLNRWLKQDSTPFEEAGIRREAADTLTVLDRMPAGPIERPRAPHVHSGVPAAAGQDSGGLEDAPGGTAPRR